MVLQEVKIRVHNACRLLIEQKIDVLKVELDKIQTAANEETKSSTGDKYETGRAMLMQEKEKLAAQQNQWALQMKALYAIDPSKSSEKIVSGSLVKTNRGIYLLGLGLGPVNVENVTYFVISGSAPIAQAMFGKRAGEQVVFNKQVFEILELA